MKCLISSFAVLLLLPLVAGCDGSTLSEPMEPKAVIEGSIDQNGNVLVLFTATASPGDEASVADKMIAFGKVTVSDGERSEVLTGAPSQKFFPPYRYYSPMGFKAEPGKRYTVTADWHGLHAEATCRMPSPTKIRSIEFEPVEGNDTLRATTLRFISPEDVPAYYYLTIRDAGSGEQPLPAMMSAVEVTDPAVEVAIPVMHARTRMNTERYVPQLISGEQLEIKLCRVERCVYQFWKTYFDMQLFSHLQFIGQSESLPSNITGGYGIWSAQGVDRRVITVP